MSDIVSEVTYPIDYTGAAATNRVGPERHTLHSRNWAEFNIIIPRAAPFYQRLPNGEPLKLKHYPSGQPLVYGKDWVEGWYFKSATDRIGKHIYGCIVMIDPTMGGEIEIESYQTLGGEWTLNQQKLEEILAEKLENPFRRYWEVIVGLPSIFPPIDHGHPVEDMSGLPQLLEAINGISDAIISAAAGGGLPEHVADRNNPHGVNAGHVGLGQVMNWAVATMADIQAGNLNAQRYMNPTMTYEMIRNIAITAINAHINNFDNPHEISPGQINAHTKEEIIDLLNDLLRGDLGVINASQFEGETRDQFMERVAQATDAQLTVMKQQIIAELAETIANFQAEDTVRFAGKTEQEWEIKIQNMTAGSGNFMFYPKLVTETGDGWTNFAGITYTKLGDISPSWEGNVKEETVNFTFSGGNAQTQLQTSVVHGSFNSSSPFSTIRLYLEAGIAPESTFILRNSATAGNYELWVRSPVHRRAMVVTVGTLETFQITGAIMAIDEEDWVPNGSEVTVPVVDRYSQINTGLVSLTGRIQTLEDRDRFCVSEEVTVGAGASRTYDLQALLGTNFGLYDIAGAEVTVRVRDLEAGSPTLNQWVDGSVVTHYAINTTNNRVIVYNMDTAGRELLVRIWATKKKA